MAGSPRLKDAASPLETEGEISPSEESGTRQRPPPHDAGGFEELDMRDLELVAAMSARPAPPRARPPAPPRARPPAPPAPPRRPPALDLDALRFDAGGLPSMPHVPIVVAPRRGPSWGTTVALAVSTLLAGGAIATLAVVWSGLRGDAAARVHRATKLAEAKAAPLAPAEVPVVIAEVPVAIAEVPVAPPASEPPATSPPVSLAEAPASAPERVAPPEPAAERAVRRATARRELRRAAPAAAAGAPEAPTSEPAEPGDVESPAPAAAPEPAQRAEPTPPPADLPAQPSREDVEQGISRALPALRACAPGFGPIDLELHIASTGRVTVAQAHSTRATPEQRSCIARAARTVRVPPFSGPRLVVRYPAQL